MRGAVARRPRGSGFASITDSFNRANSTTTLGSTDTGQAWTPLSGTWGISSNQAYAPVGTSQNHVAMQSSVSDCTVSVTIVALGTSGVETGLCFRASDDNNLFLTNGGVLYKRVAGSFTSIGSFAYSFGDVISAVLSGTSIVMKKNGSTILSITESFNQTATKHGLRTTADTSSLSRWDNFSVTVP